MIRRLTPRWRLRATAAALVVPPLVHVASLERINRWLVGSGERPLDSSVDDAAIADWVDRVLMRLPPPWRRTCLKRALVMHGLLHRAGRDAELRIGVKRDGDGKLAAHAWLVRDGIPYLEPAPAAVTTFDVITTLTSSPRTKT